MYRYKIHLFPESLKKREGLVLNSTESYVKKIAEEYTVAGMKAVNRKGIEAESVKVINGDTLEFVLFSDAWLQFPTKALRYFISKLSRNEPYKGLISENGRLFKGESYYLGESLNCEKFTLTDEQLFIEVSRLFFQPSEVNRQRIDRIREIFEGGRRDVPV